ncbi:uncharacterized protein LOC135203405 [Macrobrachium nipponense]|uniref:uncharacterized protein LOC135203405 n=1 Tax=Macrobrachium nipponense TaxID=159736 RepID=UPI0030C85D3E
MAIGRAAMQSNERLGTREGEQDIHNIQRQDLGKLGVITVKQLEEKTLEGNQEFYFRLTDLEKAYDRIRREVMFWCFRKRKDAEKLVRLVEMIYQRMSTKVMTAAGKTENFEVSDGLHQGSAASSPFLLVLVMDVLSKEIGMKCCGSCCTLMI